jgi:hypothetical protein
MTRGVETTLPWLNGVDDLPGDGASVSGLADRRGHRPKQAFMGK